MIIWLVPMPWPSVSLALEFFHTVFPDALRAKVEGMLLGQFPNAKKMVTIREVFFVSPLLCRCAGKIRLQSRGWARWEPQL